MKTIIEKKTVVIENATYIADDGKEFTSQHDCEKYENKNALEKRLEAVKHLAVLDDYPPCNGGENYESHYYRWFKVSNQEELDLLNAAFSDGSVNTAENFPEFINIESDNEDLTDGYWTHLSECKNYVTELFDKLGFIVSITQNEESGV